MLSLRMAEQEKKARHEDKADQLLSRHPPASAASVRTVPSRGARPWHDTLRSCCSARLTVRLPVPYMNIT